MFRPTQHRAPRFVQLHFSCFVILWTIWTIALLVPIPKKTAAVVLPTEEAMFWFGKSLHVCTYAFLTISGISLPWSRKQRLWLLAAFVCHGAVTEYIQLFVGRTGSVRDALLDTTGILIGWGIWSWWIGRRSSEQKSQNPNHK